MFNPVTTHYVYLIALDWFSSYLTGRIQRVVIEDSVSVDQELDLGVPQGSVLGPRILLHVHQTC